MQTSKNWFWHLSQHQEGKRMYPYLNSWGWHREAAHYGVRFLPARVLNTKSALMFSSFQMRVHSADEVGDDRVKGEISEGWALNCHWTGHCIPRSTPGPTSGEQKVLWWREGGCLLRPQAEVTLPECAVCAQSYTDCRRASESSRKVRKFTSAMMGSPVHTPRVTKKPKGFKTEAHMPPFCLFQQRRAYDKNNMVRCIICLKKKF